MSRPRFPEPVRPFCGILASSTALLCEARAALTDLFGPICAASEVEPWGFSEFYRDEMGDRVWRQYVVFAAAIAPEALIDWKLRTNSLEERWILGDGRQVNLDPGYVDLRKVVLASGKDAAHRVHLGSGIYGEVTLCFRDGRFVAMPYTYPDYASEATRGLFTRAREDLRAERARIRALDGG